MEAHQRKKKSLLPHNELPLLSGFLTRKDPMKVVLVGNDTARPYGHAASKSEPSNHPSLSMGKDFWMVLWGEDNLNRRSSLGIMDQEEGNAASAYVEGDTGYWEV